MAPGSPIDATDSDHLLEQLEPGASDHDLPPQQPRHGASRRVALIAAAAAAAALAGTALVASPGRVAAVAVLSGVEEKAKLGADESGYVTGPNEGTRTFPWSAPSMSVADAFDKSFPGGKGWEDVTYVEGTGGAVTKDSLIKWVDKELIGGTDPFAAHGGKVPVPFPEQGPNPPDQLSPGQWVTYSRRQVCFIAAKTLTGSNTDGYANGFLRFMNTAAPSLGGCTPQTGEFGKSMWYLLSTCSVDPGLVDGAQGPAILVAKANPEPSVQAVRDAANGKPLTTADMRVCQYDDGAEKIEGMKEVPSEACKQPTKDAPGKDFMTGGMSGQGMVDISASWLGGYIWGYACGIGGGQDERLMTYMPEVFLLSFFLSEAPGTNPQQRNTPQLRQPAWILGARRVMNGLDGTARFNQPMKINPDVPMTMDLTNVKFMGKTFEMGTSQPFLAFMSDNQDYEISNGCAGLPGKIQDRGDATRKARDNRNPWQRAVDPGCPFAFDKQVRAWFGATALTSYNNEIQPVLRAVVKSLGTGPWGSGLWWGDSQVFMLAMWLAHAAAAATWGEGGFPLDYYLYSAFTENPGNQCFVHAGDQCKACLNQCMDPAPPPSAYWLPGFAYSDVDPSFTDWGPPPMPPAKACVVADTTCGKIGLKDVYEAYKGETASTLWADVEKTLRGPASGFKAWRNVFDGLMEIKGR